MIRVILCQFSIVWGLYGCAVSPPASFYARDLTATTTSGETKVCLRGHFDHRFVGNRVSIERRRIQSPEFEGTSGWVQVAELPRPGWSEGPDSVWSYNDRFESACVGEYEYRATLTIDDGAAAPVAEVRIKSNRVWVDPGLASRLGFVLGKYGIDELEPVRVLASGSSRYLVGKFELRVEEGRRLDSSYSGYPFERRRVLEFKRAELSYLGRELWSGWEATRLTSAPYSGPSVD